MKNKKIGFIYLDELHHIHHFLSPAIELSKTTGYDVEILTYEAKHEYLTSLIEKFGGENLKVTKLSTYFYRKIIEKLKKRNQPSALYIYKKHLKSLLQYDALVFTDHTAEVFFKEQITAKKTNFIYIDHGAGDGAYGYGESHALYDLILVAGNKKADRLKKELKNDNLPIEITGYCKFDLLDKEISNKLHFDNSNPTILYSPHFKHELSSWYKMGMPILDFFLNNTEYNLLFAPHYNLFNKKGHGNSKIIDQKYYNASNILIDLGSENSIDMTYTISSNIYLGDVSSQVYEFMIKARPIIFINNNNVEWDGDPNYLMWRTGRKIKNIDELEKALESISDWDKDFREEQKNLFENTFDIKKESAGVRAAKIIADSLVN